MKAEKGDYNYLQQRKITQLLIALGCFILVMIAILTGYIHYGTTKNIGTVVGIVCVIPAAKFLVTYIIMFPYNVPDKEMYGRLKAYDVILICAAVMSSEEKVRYAEFIAIRDKHIFVYLNHNASKEQEIQKYLKTFICESFPGTVVKTYTDFEKYCENVERISSKEHSGADKRVADFIKINII